MPKSVAVTSKGKITDGWLRCLDFGRFILVWLLVGGVIWYFWKWPASAEAFYEKLRPNFFTGFLTLGGFLLSSKTFIVANLKKDIYESDVYHQQLRDSGVSSDEAFSPLYEVQRAISRAIALALFASIAQITLGLVGNLWAHAAASCLVALAFGGAFRALLILHVNTVEWFDQMKEARRLKMRALELEEEARRKGAAARMKEIEQRSAEVPAETWGSSEPPESPVVP